MPTPAAYLLVEGRNDQHVIWALCKQYQVPQSFSVQTPEDREKEGIEALLEGLPLRLKAENLLTLGIVVDVDQDLNARWQAIRNHLTTSGYRDVPRRPLNAGWISASSDLPRVGVWLMPDNQISGMLEDFVVQLMPPEDDLRPRAERVLQEIEQARLNRYRVIHHPKALIHTWLAWQETPGMPMGQAITAQVLRHDSPIAHQFIAWLKQLFELQ